MPSIQTVVDRLNDAVQRDWMGMQHLLQGRVQTTDEMRDHPTVIVKPFQGTEGTHYGMGFMGLINGLVRETNEDVPIEAIYTMEAPIELMGFALRGQELDEDARTLAVNEVVAGRAYRVQDKVNNYWAGRLESPRPGEEAAIYLRLPTGQRAQIFHHDVKQIVAFTHPSI